MTNKVVLYNPFNGMPRHPNDIASDPQGLLLWDGEEPLRAAKVTKVEPKCSKHPDAPHGFDRNGSHSAGRYKCDCEGWVPDGTTDGTTDGDTD